MMRSLALFHLLLPPRFCVDLRRGLQSERIDRLTCQDKWPQATSQAAVWCPLSRHQSDVLESETTPSGSGAWPGGALSRAGAAEVQLASRRRMPIGGADGEALQQTPVASKDAPPINPSETLTRPHPTGMLKSCWGMSLRARREIMPRRAVAMEEPRCSCQRIVP